MNQNNIKIKILYEDDFLLVVDKPTGLVVNDSDTQKNSVTLQRWMSTRLGDTSSTEFSNSNTSTDFESRSGIVHRLDKETSGVLIIAKDEDSFEHLQRQFKERSVQKTYEALIFGKIKGLDVGGKIVIDAPIGRNPINYRKFAIVKDGRSALTEISLVDVIREKFSLVRCYPKSGRTHQIRVHLTALGNPIAGDILYSGANRWKKYQEIFKRQFLHASEISFKHPKSHKLIVVKSDLPRDLQDVLDFLRVN